jgi:DNA-binding CsgD family transcriptional regulator
MDVNNLVDCVPVSIYWKDKQGRYCGRNHFAFKSMQSAKLEVNTTQDFILGKTDQDIFPLKTANELRKNDLEIMRARCELVKEEKILLPNGQYQIFLSSKRPWRDANNNVIGIIGSSIDISCYKKIENSQAHIEFNQLTKRQSDCLIHLIQGSSIKEIAQNLKLSPRTVEHYLDSCKVKLNCHSRAELISVGLSLYFIKLDR